MKNMPEDIKERQVAAITKAHKEWYAKMSNEEQMKYLEPWILAGQASPSSIEKSIWKVLDKLKIVYKTQVSFDNHKFVADIFIPIQRLIIECNGDYWHSLKERIKRDKELREYAKNNGYNLIELPECEIRKNPKQALEDGFKKLGVI